MSKLKTAKNFTFAELASAGRDPTVPVTDDLLLVAVDLVYVVAESATRSDASRKLKSHITNGTFPEEKIVRRSFPGSGKNNTCLVSFENAIELIMVLGGKGATKARCQFAKIIQRYLAGDKSLITEIEANAASDDQIPQLARASLAAEVPAVEELSLTRKRKLEDLEVAKIEMDIQERAENVKAKSLANRVLEQSIRANELTNLAMTTTSYAALCQDTVMDERARMMFKDNYLNIGMMNAVGGLITNGPPNTPISLSMIATDMGLKLTPGDLISDGTEIAKRYKKLHGDKPTKHPQLCTGKSLKVNTYMESDRALVEEVLRERHCAPPPRPQRGMLQHFAPAR